MLLAIFLIIFSAIASRDIRYGVYLVIFLMPLYLWRFSVLGIPTTTLEIMIYILFFIWIINFRISRSFVILVKAVIHFRNKAGLLAQDKKNIILNIGIALLFFGVIVSTSISSDTRTSLGIFKGWFFDPFLFFIIFVNVIKTKKEMCPVLKSWLASGAAVSIISIFYLLNDDLTFDGRLRAFFLSPNHLAMYISMPFLIALGFLTNKASRNKNNIDKKVEIGKLGNWEIFKKQIANYKLLIANCQLLITILIIILIPLYFTYSFGAFLGIFAGILYLTVANKNIFKKHKTKIYLIGLVLAIGLSFVFLTSGKFNGILNSNNRSSFHSRLMIWSAAAEIIKDNPLFGIGPGTFQKTYLSYAGRFSEPYLEWAVPQPHNIFLAFYLQTGLIGFVGFVLILFWFFQKRRHCIMPPLNSDKNNIQYPNIPISNILISLMICILIHGLADTTYWKNDLALMFWLIIGGKLASFKIRARPASYDKDGSNLKIKSLSAPQTHPARF